MWAARRTQPIDPENPEPLTICRFTEPAVIADERRCVSILASQDNRACDLHCVLRTDRVHPEEPKRDRPDFTHRLDLNPGIGEELQVRQAVAQGTLRDLPV